jgi:anti-anti-sigma regulatory factor
MNAPPTVMQVAIIDQLVLIKITGRANFNASVDFKNLLLQMRERGSRAFALELSDCAIMDSTFLGVLAGQGQKALETEPPGCPIQILNASQRIIDLLENLGVAHLFGICSQPVPDFTKFETVKSAAAAPSRVEMSRNCLEAHEILMAINPDNIPKFKDVAKFLAEDLKKASGAS